MNICPSRRLAAVLLTIGALGSCADAGAPPPPPTGRLAIAVSPLALTGVTDATYTVTVTNGLGATVWSRPLSASQYGDGAGAISYVGPCDADPAAATHTIALVLDELRDATGPLQADVDYMNPAPASDPLTLIRTCEVDRDVAVTFDLTVARAARQGFFDVAIGFSDIFCSAKLDCERAPGLPLELLFTPDGVRALTAVLGFACTAGPDSATTLWMDRVIVTCEHGGPFVVDVAAGPGNLNPAFTAPATDLLFQAAVYRGVEALGGATAWNKAYWNVALGLNSAAFATLGVCTLTTTASATDGPLVDGATPAGVRWPVVAWEVPLTTGAGARACTRHQLDDGGGVATRYTASTGHGFYAAFARATGLVTVTGAVPDATSLLTCADPTVPAGGQTSCTLVPRLAGAPITTAAGNFTPAALPAGTLSPLTPAYGALFAFTFTAASTSALVTLDSGVGATTTVAVTAAPDASSGLVCAATLLPPGGQTLCTVTPRRAGAPIQALASAFSPTATLGTTSAVTPAFGDALTFTFTAPATSGAVTVGDGFNTTVVTVYDAPDATSGLVCAATTLALGASTSCTITSRQAGAPVTALASAFTPSATSGTVGALSPSVGTSLTFTYTASATATGAATVGDGFNAVALTIYAAPDATSLLSCSPASIVTGATSWCTITPRRAGATITAQASAFAPSASAGAVGALSPSLGTAFTFTFTAPMAAQTVTVSSGLSDTAVTVTASCGDGVKNGSETDVDCGGGCAACINGRSCAVADDCTSKYCGATVCGWAPSCAALRTGGVTTSGSYTIDPDGAAAGGTYAVFCDMLTSGGGWTVFKNADIGAVTGVNQAWRTDKARVVAYIHVDGDPVATLSTTVLSQLAPYTASNLSVVQNATNFQVYFVPGVVNGMTNGFHSNSSELSFVNCDSNANSYFLFHKAGSATGGSPYALEASWRGTKVAYGATLPADHFGNVTVAFGGCGAYTQNVGYTVALGLK